MEKRAFEDLKVGQIFRGPNYPVSEDEIIEFGQKYDPQDFHTDPSKAGASFFGQHVASGWHTMAISMRLLVTGEHNFKGGMIGLGVESVRWKRPTLAGMVLTLKSEVVELRASPKFPKHGIVKLKQTVEEVGGKPVAELTTLQLVERRYR